MAPERTQTGGNSLEEQLRRAGCTSFEAKQLVDIACEDWPAYTNPKVLPLSNFFKHLTRRSGASPPLRLWLPDTIVAEGEGRVLTWYYSNPKGEVCVETGFKAKHVFNRFAMRRDPDAPVAVVKVPHPSGKHSKTVTKSTGQLMETIEGLVMGSCIQRLVPPGGMHAVVFRCICKPGVETRRFVLSGKAKVGDENVPVDDRYLCSVRGKDPPQATLLARKALPELNETLDRLREYLLLHGLPSHTIAVDFVRDRAGSIWLTQVKGFQASSDEPRSFPVMRPVLFPCAFCFKKLEQEHLEYRLSYAALGGMYEALRRVNCAIPERKSAADRRPADLRDRGAVCRECFDLFETLQSLVATQKSFYRLLEFVRPPDFFRGEGVLPQPDEKGIVAPSEEAGWGGAHQPMPPGWELPSTLRLETAQEVRRVEQTIEVGGTVLARPLRVFHVFLFLREFGNVPHKTFQNGVEVRFDLLGLKYRTPVRLEGKSSQKFVRVPVRTFVSRVVFSRTLEAIGETTKKPGHVDVKVVDGNGELIASGTVDLRMPLAAAREEPLITTSYLKSPHMKGATLTAAVGLLEAQVLDAQRIPLDEYGDVFVPKDPRARLFQPLPDAWLELLVDHRDAWTTPTLALPHMEADDASALPEERGFSLKLAVLRGGAICPGDEYSVELRAADVVRINKSVGVRKDDGTVVVPLALELRAVLDGVLASDRLVEVRVTGPDSSCHVCLPVSGVLGPAVFELSQDADPLTLVGLAAGPPQRGDDDAVVFSDSAGVWRLAEGTPSLSRVVATHPPPRRRPSATPDSSDSGDLSTPEPEPRTTLEPLGAFAGAAAGQARRDSAHSARRGSSTDFPRNSSMDLSTASPDSRRNALERSELTQIRAGTLPGALRGPGAKLVNGLGARRPGTPGPRMRERQQLHMGLNKRGFSEEQFEDLRTAFKTFCDQNNEVPVFRFYSLCVRIGITIPESVIAKRMDVIDADGSGTISLQEFIDAARRLYDEETQVAEAIATSGWSVEEAQSYRGLFLEADDDGSGELDAPELQELCEELGFELEVEMIEELMAPYDADGSGNIDFPEFLHFLKDASALFETKMVVDDADELEVMTDWNAPRQ